MVDGKRPRIPARHHRTLFSGIDFVEASDDQRPLIVGERTNEVGSRKFKRADHRREIRGSRGDCQATGKEWRAGLRCESAERRSRRVVRRRSLLRKMIRVVKAPTMIDTTDPVAIERALTYCQGKSIINSINLEDGLDKV
jgi:5-methyltetrahydrofolate--homocysteine methyltransferase